MSRLKHLLALKSILTKLTSTSTQLYFKTSSISTQPQFNLILASTSTKNQSQPQLKPNLNSVSTQPKPQLNLSLKSASGSSQPQLNFRLNLSLDSTSTITSTQYGCDIKATQSSLKRLKMKIKHW